MSTKFLPFLVFLSFSSSAQTFENWHFSTSNHVYFNSVIPKNDGSFICMARIIEPLSHNILGGEEYMIDSSGNVVYQYCFDQNDFPTGMTEIQDSTFYAFGDNVLFRFDIQGNKIWEKHFIGLTQSIGIINVFRHNSRLLIIGGTPSGFIFLNTDLQGNILSQYMWGFPYYLMYVNVLKNPGNSNNYQLSGCFFDSTAQSVKLISLSADSNGIIISAVKATEPGLTYGYLSGIENRSNQINTYWTITDSIHGNMTCSILNWSHVNWCRTSTNSRLFLENDSILLYDEGPIHNTEQIEILDTNGNLVNNIVWQTDPQIGSPMPFRIFKNGTTINCFTNNFSHTRFNINNNFSCHVNLPSTSSFLNLNFNIDTIILNQFPCNFHDTLIVHGSHSTILSTRNFCSTINSIIPISNLDLEIYPNPASDILNLKLADTSMDEFIITIYDSHGKYIRKIKQPAIENTYSIQTNDLNEGIYFLNIYSERVNINKTFQIIR